MPEEVRVGKRTFTRKDLKSFTPRQFAKVMMEEKLLDEVIEQPVIRKDFTRRRESGFAEFITDLDGNATNSSITIESRVPRKDRDVALAHEMIHILNPSFSEKKVLSLQDKTFRRDPYDDVIGFRIPHQQQSIVQLSPQIKLRAEVKRKSFGNFRVFKMRNDVFGFNKRNKKQRRGFL